MKLVESTADGVTVVEVSGRIDSTTAGALSERLVALVGSGRKHLVVDLNRIAYISSAGFRSLLIANRAAKDNRGVLGLCGVQGEVKRLFETGAFTDLFLICATRADAIAKLQQ